MPSSRVVVACVVMSGSEGGHCGVDLSQDLCYATVFGARAVLQVNAAGASGTRNRVLCNSWDPDARKGLEPLHTTTLQGPGPSEA